MTVNKFNYIELFAGIGGFRQALDRLGGECVLSSEIDKHANTAYKALYGHETEGDVMKIEAEDVPDHDLLVGGFPCQAFSIAGKRGGFDDARGTLFFEALRIAEAKRPKALFLENVKGLVSHDKGRTLDTMLKALNEIGYVSDFQVLNSKFFGVPQNRERIFIIAFREDLVKTEKWNITGNDIVAKAKKRNQQYEGLKTFNFKYPEQKECDVRLRDILEESVDEKYYLSEEKTAALLAKLEEQEKGLAIREATKKGYAVAEEGDAVNFQFPDSKTRRGRVGKQIAQTLEASSINQGVVEQFSEGEGVAYCVDANYLKGISEGGVGKGRRTQIVEEVKALTERRTEEAKEIRKSYRKESRKDFSPRRGKKLVPRTDEVANCVTATQTIEQSLLEKPFYRIRKLTPLECWRLQGFPDEAHEAVKAAGISDSQRYKQAGNAVTVNVIEEIGRNIIDVMENGHRPTKKEGQETLFDFEE